MIGNKFFGRAYYLEILEKRLKGIKDGYRQNIAFLGDESIGKTSIVLRFLNYFQDNAIIPVYLDIGPLSLENFTRKFIGVLLYNFLRNSDIPMREDLDFLMNKSEKYIPRAIEKIRHILSCVGKRQKSSLFADLLALPEIINQETGKSCAVIFDEFHNLESMGIRNLYREWSKALVTQKNTMYIIISSARAKAKKVLSENLSLLFGNFQIIEVECFDLKAGNEFLDAKFGFAQIDRALKDFLLHFTGGHPFYLEALSDALVRSTAQNIENNSITYAHFTDTLEELLFEEAGLLNQRFSSYLRRLNDNRNARDYTSLLYLISSGNNRIKDIAHILRKQKKDVLQKIDYLLETDAITRNGDFFKINDRVFSFWLKFVYKEKIDTLNFDTREKKKVFKNHIDEMAKEFIVNSGKPLSERMTELLRLFENEAVCLDSKRLRLTHFREIRSLGLSCRNLKQGLIARSADSLWIIAFKKDLITEDDISEFTRECKKYRNRVQRKIVITYADVETNARLKALEAKIWTWNLNNLNQLFDLFNKPRVIS
jgi:GTPase SAR1 family protein